MTFDLSAVGTSRADAGVPMTIIHPDTRQPLLNDDKTPVTITLLGQSSEVFQDTLAMIQRQRAQIAADNQTISQDQLFGEDTETLVACTVGWTIEQLDGQPFPFTRKNSRTLWSDRRFRWLRQPALNFILRDGNFLPEASKISNGTRDTSSGSTNPSLAAA